VRTPPVEVPAAAQSGEAAPGSKALCALFGSSRAFSPARLKALYGSKAQYLQRFDDATRQAVNAGHVLPADAAALDAEAQAVDVPG
jgi:hypothetical protein